MLVVKRREMRWQLDEGSRIKMEKGQNIYVMMRRMQEREKSRNTGRGQGFLELRSLYIGRGMQAVVGLN